MNMRSEIDKIPLHSTADCLHAINRICHACASNFGGIIPSYLLIALFSFYLVVSTPALFLSPPSSIYY